MKPFRRAGNKKPRPEPGFTRTSLNDQKGQTSTVTLALSDADDRVFIRVRVEHVTTIAHVQLAALRKARQLIKLEADRQWAELGRYE